MACETIPEMRARYERTIADLQGQIEQLRMDVAFERRAREVAEVKAERIWPLAWKWITHVCDPAPEWLEEYPEQATTP